MNDFKYFERLGEAIAVVPESVVSRVLFSGEGINITLFAFDAGQGLTEHTASARAWIYFVDGEGEITLGKEVKHVIAGTWVEMAPGLRHALKAKTALRMVLVLKES